MRISGHLGADPLTVQITINDEQNSAGSSLAAREFIGSGVNVIKQGPRFCRTGDFGDGPPGEASGSVPDRVADAMHPVVDPAGGVVLDPFVGSLTTANAALQLGRNSVGVDPVP
jgi:hypothetical protein